MKRLRIMVMAAVAVASIVLGTSPASAQTVVNEWHNGAGYYSPGLSNLTVGQAQLWAFTSEIGFEAGVANGAPVFSTAACALRGTDTIGTIPQSSGTFDGYCSGAVSGTVTGTFTRTGANSQFNGTSTGTATGTFTGNCTWLPTTTPPITTYRQTCSFSIVGP